MDERTLVEIDVRKWCVERALQIVLLPQNQEGRIIELAEKLEKYVLGYETGTQGE